MPSVACRQTIMQTTHIGVKIFLEHIQCALAHHGRVVMTGCQVPASYRFRAEWSLCTEPTLDRKAAPLSLCSQPSLRGTGCGIELRSLALSRLGETASRALLLELSGSACCRNSTFSPANSRRLVHRTHPLRYHSSQARHGSSSCRRALSAPDGLVASLL